MDADTKSHTPGAVALTIYNSGRVPVFAALVDYGIPADELLLMFVKPLVCRDYAKEKVGEPWRADRARLHAGRFRRAAKDALRDRMPVGYDTFDGMLQGADDMDAEANLHRNRNKWHRDKWNANADEETASVVDFMQEVFGAPYYAEVARVMNEFLLALRLDRGYTPDAIRKAVQRHRKRLAMRNQLPPEI